MAELLARELRPTGLVLPGPPPGPRLPVRVAGLPLEVPELARERGIPVLYLDPGQDPAPLRALAPDLALVACWPWRLPRAVYELPPLGCLNLHPSLLPRYRGPAPLFWQLRAGEQTAGVTLHRMDQGLDTGPILAQVQVDLPDGAGAWELDALLARNGAGLVQEALPAYAAGRIEPRRQDESLASRQPSPQAEDFRLSPRWSARHALRFMRGTAVWGCDYPLRLGEREWRLREALGWAQDAGPAEGWQEVGGELWVRLDPGVLHARLAGP
jgi:methionyl-tRNA formyltransferase